MPKSKEDGLVGILAGDQGDEVTMFSEGNVAAVLILVSEATVSFLLTET